MFGVCMRFSLFVLCVAALRRPITRPMTPTGCEMIKRMKEKPRHPYEDIREERIKKVKY
jgi:hypothetical protein